MKRIFTLVVFFLFCFERDVDSQAVYAGVVPSYSQYVSMNDTVYAGCYSSSPPFTIQLDMDTMADVYVSSYGYCELGGIGLKHSYFGYFTLNDSSIEIRYLNGSFMDYCSSTPVLKYQSANTLVNSTGLWTNDIFNVFRKKYTNNFYLYGWISVFGLPPSFRGAQFTGYTKLPSHASEILDTINCNTNYTFVNGITLNNILHDTTYISTFVHPVTGLDSLVFTKLHVTTYQASVYDTICKGTTFNFIDGTSAMLTHDTIKTNWFTSLNGCDSIIFNHVHVKPISTSTFSQTVCVNQLPYVWHGQSLTTNGTYTYSTTNVFGCDSIVTLHFSVNVDTLSILNETRCINHLPLLWNGQYINHAGNYYYTTFNSLGCDSTALFNLTVMDTSYSESHISTCTNQLPFIWNGINLTTSGKYQYKMLNSCGCDSIAYLDFNLGNTSAVILDTSVQSLDLPFEWHGLSLMESGVYTFQAYTTEGCDSITTLYFLVADTSVPVFQVHPNPTTSIFYFSDADNKEKELFDSVGRLILFTRENEMDVSHLAKGIYYIRCDQQVKKVLKE